MKVTHFTHDSTMTNLPRRDDPYRPPPPARPTFPPPPPVDVTPQQLPRVGNGHSARRRPSGRFWKCWARAPAGAGRHREPGPAPPVAVETSLRGGAPGSPQGLLLLGLDLTK